MPSESRDSQFEAYVRTHRPRLVRFATLVAGDPYRGEDALQSALTRLYLAWPRVVGGRLVDAYVRRSIVNAVIDDSRRSWRRAELLSGEVPDRPAPTEPDSTSEVVLAAVAALPARMRAVVVLRFFEDLSVEQTARTLRCSEGTVKSQSARALAKLRPYLITEQLEAASTWATDLPGARYA